MAVHNGTSSALSLSKLGLALGNGHAYAAAGSVLGFFLGTAIVIAAGTLLVVGLVGMGSSASDEMKQKADQT